VCDRRVLGPVPFDVGLLKTKVQSKVWKGIGACKLGMASREFDLPCGANVREEATRWPEY
jgi:hypothetical protein